MRSSIEPARVVLLSGLAVGLAAAPAAAQTAVNFARNQFVTASSTTADHEPEFLTDGKVGPRNRWKSNDRGRHRANIFFDEPVEIGSLHVYSFGYDLSPASSFSVLYLDPQTSALTTIAGAGASGNTDEAVNIILPAPVTTTQLQVRIDDSTVSVDEIAIFPPNGGVGYPLGTDVTMHQARQHRLALTPASSRLGGTQRRAIVDGFVDPNDVWSSNGVGPHWIELDVTDPPETNPATVRVTTTPVRIGSAHIYSGDAVGNEIVDAGKFQHWDGMNWIDIAGSTFTGNTAEFLAIEFGETVETSRMRLVIDDLTDVSVREIVPLPPLVNAQMWPEGTSVVVGPEGDYRTFGDDYYTISSVQGSLALTTDGAGAVTAETDAGVLGQQYQVLYNVGSDTYRIRNRLTGQCLAVAGASAASGAAVIESDYSALPHQRWCMVDLGGDTQFVNAYSGMAMALDNSAIGTGLVQEPPRTDRPLQRFGLTQRAAFGKKGQGGQIEMAAVADIDWAYNWGKEDTFGAGIDYWPMQWGSFFWDLWPEMVPLWKRDAEPILLMGYNEPDASEQANIPVQTGIDMWPRLEVIDLPLLGPAPVNPTNSWITSFMNGVDQHEMRVEYLAVHRYGSPNVDTFINALSNTRNTFGGRDLMVTEFSTVDWSNTNGWTDEQCFNFFAEVFWRMENLPWVRRYAVFTFIDEPGNPISDNRGEMLRDVLPGETPDYVFDVMYFGQLRQNVTFTPEGRLHAAWDGDTTIRTDTPYNLHNEGTFRRIGGVAGMTNEDSVQVGDKNNHTEPFQWHLVPTGTSGEFYIESVDDGRYLTNSGRGIILVEPQDAGAAAVFKLNEAEHGWFYIEDALLDRRLQSLGAAGFDLAAAGTTSTDARWRFVPVLDGPPAAPRQLSATSIGSGQVDVSWDDHGFRDLEGMTIVRHDAGGPTTVATGVIGTSFVDTVPAPGVYTYDVTAVGDTGTSSVSSAMVTVGTCPADFDANFITDENDVLAALAAIELGLDFDSSGSADFFDVIAFLVTFDQGCP